MSNTEKPKDECTLSDAELTDKVAEWANKLCKTGGKAWTLQVPVNFNEDPDMLIVELIKRFKEANDEIKYRTQVIQVVNSALTALQKVYHEEGVTTETIKAILEKTISYGLYEKSSQKL